MTKTVGIDTSAAVYVLQNAPEASNDEMVLRARAFLAHCEATKTLLRLPSIVVSELLVVVPEEERPEYLSDLSRRFIIDSFDAGAALHAARIHSRWLEKVKKGSAKKVEPTQCTKADSMILGTAKEHKYDSLLVVDGDFRTLSEGKIAIQNLTEIEIPQPQPVAKTLFESD